MKISAFSVTYLENHGKFSKDGYKWVLTIVGGNHRHGSSYTPLNSTAHVYATKVSSDDIKVMAW